MAWLRSYGEDAELVSEQQASELIKKEEHNLMAIIKKKLTFDFVLEGHTIPSGVWKS